MTKTLYLCGAGNSEGVRLALTINRKHAQWDRIVLLDDDPSKHGLSILGVEIVGGFGLLEQARAGAAEVANMVARSAVKRWSARSRIEDYGLPFATMINPAIDTEGVELARDVVVYQNAAVGPQTSLGDGSVVFMGAVVGHESQVGRCCILAPNAVINARVLLGDGVYVGTNAAIVPEVKVGPWATIAAGSAVTCDVPAGATVIGVPGKIILTLSQKIKMGVFKSLPAAVRWEIESQVEKPGAPTNGRSIAPGQNGDSPIGGLQWNAANR